MHLVILRRKVEFDGNLLTYIDIIVSEQWARRMPAVGTATSKALRPRPHAVTYSALQILSNANTQQRKYSAMQILSNALQRSAQIPSCSILKTPSTASSAVNAHIFSSGLLNPCFWLHSKLSTEKNPQNFPELKQNPNSPLVTCLS
jgi:hypothetical protein